MDTIFFRLLDGVSRPARLSGAIEELREGGEPADAYSTEPASLGQVPGSPLAYWVSETVRSKFVELPTFEGNGRVAQHGASTKDDFRFIRTTWEVAANTLLGLGLTRFYGPIRVKRLGSVKGVKEYGQDRQALLA